MSVRREIRYRGNVQGVGFRYTVCQIARLLETSGARVTGYVQNLSDGRVRLVVEGGESDVDQFTDSIAERMTDHIREVESKSASSTGEFEQFEIRH